MITQNRCVFTNSVIHKCNSFIQILISSIFIQLHMFLYHSNHIFLNDLKCWILFFADNLNCLQNTVFLDSLQIWLYFWAIGQNPNRVHRSWGGRQYHCLPCVHVQDNLKPSFPHLFKFLPCPVPPKHLQRPKVYKKTTRLFCSYIQNTKH